MTTPISDGTKRDPDWRGNNDGVGGMLMLLLERVRELETRCGAIEAQQAADHSAILTIQTRLGLINAVLHLW